MLTHWGLILLLNFVVIFLLPTKVCWHFVCVWTKLWTGHYQYIWKSLYVIYVSNNFTPSEIICIIAYGYWITLGMNPLLGSHFLLKQNSILLQSILKVLPHLVLRLATWLHPSTNTVPLITIPLNFNLVSCHQLPKQYFNISTHNDN